MPDFILNNIVAILFVVIVTSFNSLHCEEEKMTDWYINAGLFAGSNIYKSNFTSLSYINCCNETDNTYYDLGFGVGYEAIIGVGNRLNLLNGIILGLDLSFANLSATYSNEGKISNWIDIDTYGDLITKKYLGVSLFAISLAPNILFKVSDNIPLSVSAGLKLGTLMTGNFEQYEEIVTEGYYFTNNSKKINDYTGSIPNLSKFYAALSLKFIYDVYKWNGWLFSPTLALNYGLTNVVSDLNWKTHSAYLGLSISKRVPKNIDEKPESNILPKNLELPTPSIGTLDMIVNSNYDDGSTIYLPVELYVTKTITSFLPIIYFKNNTAEIIDGYDTAIFETVDRNWTIEIGIANSEKNNAILVKARFDAINALLIKHKLDPVKDYKVNYQEKTAKYNEIEQESSFVRFVSANNTIPIINSEIISNDMVIKEVGEDKIEIRAKIVADAKPYNYLVKYGVNGNIINEFSTENATIIINKETIGLDSKINDTNFSTDLTILCTVNDNENKQKTIDFHYKIKPNYHYNYITNTNFNNWKIIGFFAFDSDEFITVDSNEIKFIKEELHNGKSIEIIGLTDHFGTYEYNHKLSLQRANQAINLLDSTGKWTSQIRVSKDSFENKENSLYNRQKCRAVIYKLK